MKGKYPRRQVIEAEAALEKIMDRMIVSSAQEMSEAQELSAEETEGKKVADKREPVRLFCRLELSRLTTFLIQPALASAVVTNNSL